MCRRGFAQSEINSGSFRFVCFLLNCIYSATPESIRLLRKMNDTQASADTSLQFDGKRLICIYRLIYSMNREHTHTHHSHWLKSGRSIIRSSVHRSPVKYFHFLVWLWHWLWGVCAYVRSNKIYIIRFQQRRKVNELNHNLRPTKKKTTTSKILTEEQFFRCTRLQLEWFVAGENCRESEREQSVPEYNFSFICQTQSELFSHIYRDDTFYVFCRFFPRSFLSFTLSCKAQS